MHEHVAEAITYYRAQNEKLHQRRLELEDPASEIMKLERENAALRKQINTVSMECEQLRQEHNDLLQEVHTARELARQIFDGMKVLVPPLFYFYVHTNNGLPLEHSLVSPPLTT